MILASTLVFLFGVFLGWLYGQRSGRIELLELRRQKQIGRIGSRDQKHYSSSHEISTSEAGNSSTASEAATQSSSSLSANRSSLNEKSSDNLSVVTNASVKSDKKSWVGVGEHDFDELYKIAGRVKPLEFDLKQSWRRVAELEIKNNLHNAPDNTEVRNLVVSSSQARSNVASDSSASSGALMSVEQDTGELDELYRLSARVKPLEYDLTQRKIEVRALKQALQEIRRTNDKKLVSIRLQAENQCGLLYKEKLAEKQNQIDSLHTKLSGTSNSESQKQKLQAQVERVKTLERERDQLRDQSKSQLENIRVLTERSNTLESRTKSLQQELSELKQERVNISGSIDHFNTQIAKREKQLDELREKQFLLDQKNQIFESINVQQSRELASTKKQVAGTLENLTQSEKRVAELQKEVSGLNQQLNSHAAEFDAAQLSLKEAGERIVQLVDRVKSVDAQARQMSVLTGKLQDRDRDIGILNTQLMEHGNQITELRTELETKHDLNLVQQERLEQIPALEATVLESQQELVQVKKRDEQVDSLRAEITTKDEQIVNLQKQSDRVVSLESAAKTREAHIRKLSDKITQADKLEKQLIEKDRKIASLKRVESKVCDQQELISDLKKEFNSAITDKKMLENYQLHLRQELAIAKKAASEVTRVRAELVKSKKVEAQLAQAQDELIKARQMTAELKGLKTVAIELEQSRLEIKNLRQSLEKAEIAAVAAKQNSIEVRRLRSEMQSLQSMRDNSVSKVQSLEKQVHEQERQIATNKQLKERVRELESVEADNVRRDQQIAELKNRLIVLRNDRTPVVDNLKKRSTKIKSKVPLTPLYVAPAEKDDLKKINGIGPVMEKMLNSLGVTSFKQLAEFKPDDITTVTDAIEAFPGRIERDNWVGGAKEQYAKKHRKADA